MDKVEDCLSDFRACPDLTAENEPYPLIHWLYTFYCELGRYKEAQECLSLIKDDVVPPQMDYGYSMCVKLYKGLVKPEEFIDEEKWPRSFFQGKTESCWKRILCFTVSIGIGWSMAMKKRPRKLSKGCWR